MTSGELSCAAPCRTGRRLILLTAIRCTVRSSAWWCVGRRNGSDLDVAAADRGIEDRQENGADRARLLTARRSGKYIREGQ